jgi:outer membrane protein OmpA-like peptidoglycan-associated protein
MALPIAATAQPVTGIYVGAGAGADFQLNQDVKNVQLQPGTTGGLSTSGQMKFSTGFASGLEIGYGFGNGLRAEIEGDYLNTKGKGYTGFTRGFIPQGGGTQQKYGPMVNVLYDFNGLSPSFVPYLGAGVGYQWIQNKFHVSNGGTYTAGATTVTPGSLLAQTNGTNGTFAYQGIAGFAIPIASVPGLAVTADYRFLGTTGNQSYSTTYRSTVNGVARQTGGRIQFGPTKDNIVMVGVRYNFGVAPPPPPPVAAAPVPSPISRSYLVFFDWDKYNLTERGRQIVAEAAANSTKVQYTRIEVNGYTDTSGTPKYNMGLSLRRANTVATELVKDGVPKAAISIQGFGDEKEHLLVPTGPGVREPQNRRVEIIIK